MNIKSLNFINAHENLPTEQGLYLWKTNLDGFEIVFPAFVKERFVNGDVVLTPNILPWNGFSSDIPDVPLSWAKTDTSFKTKTDQPLALEKEELIIIDQEVQKCPFCEQTPKIIYMDKNQKSNPLNANKFHLECCDWISPVNFRESLAILIEDWHLIQPNKKA